MGWIDPNQEPQPVASKRFEMLFPPHLRGNWEFKILINIFGHEAEITEAFIDLLPDVMNLDKTPVSHLDLLGGMVGYQYQDGYPAQASREAIRNVWSIYRARGTEENICKATDFSVAPAWYGEDVFLDKSWIPPREAWIFYPYLHLFEWDISKWDSGFRYQDEAFWRYGVIEIYTPQVSDRLRGVLREVVPAGIRYKWCWIHSMIGPDGKLLHFPYETMPFTYDIHYTTWASVNKLGSFTWDSKRWGMWDRDKWAGSQNVRMWCELYPGTMGATDLDLLPSALSYDPWDLTDVTSWSLREAQGVISCEVRVLGDGIVCEGWASYTEITPSDDGYTLDRIDQHEVLDWYAAVYGGVVGPIEVMIIPSDCMRVSGDIASYLGIWPSDAGYTTDRILEKLVYDRYEPEEGGVLGPMETETLH